LSERASGFYIYFVIKKERKKEKKFNWQPQQPTRNNNWKFELISAILQKIFLSFINFFIFD